MKIIIGVIGFLAVLIAAYVGYDMWRDGDWPFGSKPQMPAQIEAPRPVAPAVEQPAHYPIPQSAVTDAAQNPLPPLQNSDHAITDALSSLLSRKTVVEFFYPEKIVRRIVATIDNLPRHTVAIQVFPVKPVGGKFLTEGTGQNIVIAPKNSARYAPYVHLMEMVDAKKLVALYAHFYPLFQQAYQELGYPGGYFNDRLIAVIDHLLATPETSGPISLVQPKVLFQFADQQLENESAGRKILMRMGADNAAKVKSKLREIRQAITGADLAK
ncbi:MAG TPA: DUF3014 domain-containing protein [Burkholderiaceae bacterium]|jgi:hypothetical protein